MTEFKNSKFVILAAAALGLAAMTAGAVYAANPTAAANPGGLVAALAQRFGLAQADVQQVFDEHHAEMQAIHQQAYKDRLAKAVSAGKLTQAQSDMLMNKAQELEALRASLKTTLQDKSSAEARQFFQTQKEALEKWATDNGIPAYYLPGLGGFGHHGLGFGPMHFGGMQSAQNSGN